MAHWSWRRAPTLVSTASPGAVRTLNNEAAHQLSGTASFKVSATRLNASRLYTQQSPSRARRVIRPKCEARLTSWLCVLAAAECLCCTTSLTRTVEVRAARLSSSPSFSSRSTRSDHGAPADIKPSPSPDRRATPSLPHDATHCCGGPKFARWCPSRAQIEPG